MYNEKIIFLDFDGVINGSGPIRYIIWRILSKLNLKSLYDKIYKEDVYGIHTKRVRRLATICHITGAKVVLTSSWRYSVYDVLIGKPTSDENINKLLSLFCKYNIDVIGKTDKDIDGIRYKEILDWLNKNKGKVKDYIILDDEWSHLQIFLNDKLIITSDSKPGRNILGYWYCRDGLRNIHVIKAINKLGINWRRK